VATAGTDEFTSTLIDHVFDLWVSPEIQRRGLTFNRAGIRKVLVELEPGKAPRVLLNEEAELIAAFVPRRDIAEGADVTLGDIEHLTDLRPASIEPNSGWVVFARLGIREAIVFDFRYNRDRASHILTRAREFLSIAKTASETSPSVAVDLAFSGAELAVQSEMMSLQSHRNNHQERAKWLAGWARNDNAPREHADLLWYLADLRGSARYGEGELRLRPARLPHVIRTVEEMIGSAAQRIETD
jgi:hypothetical protein